MSVSFAVVLLAGGVFLALRLLEALSEYIARKIREAGMTVTESREPMAGYQPTAGDLELAERSRQLLDRHLPNGIQDLAAMNLTRRQKCIAALSEDLCNLYDVEVGVLKFVSDRELKHAAGAYDDRARALLFNVDMLASSRPDLLWMMVDTVFHECRHALQHAAISRSGYPYGSHEQRIDWAVNFLDGNYLTPDKDGFEAYRKQPVEFDAENFARTVLRNFN